MRFRDSACRKVLAARIKRLGVGGMALACIALAGAVVAYATQIVNNPDTTVRFLSPNKASVRHTSAEIWVGSEKSNTKPKPVGSQANLTIPGASKKHTPALGKRAAPSSTAQIRIKQGDIGAQGKLAPAYAKPARKSLVETIIDRARRSSARAVPDNNVAETWISDQRPAVVKPAVVKPTVVKPVVTGPTVVRSAVVKPQAAGVASRLRAAELRAASKAGRRKGRAAARRRPNSMNIA